MTKGPNQTPVDGQPVRNSRPPHALILVWITCFFWLIGTVYAKKIANQQKTTVARQGRMYKAIVAYKNSFGKIPETLSDLRVFARQQKIRVTPYDALGQRMQYLPLSDMHFVLRSFGKDGQADTLPLANDVHKNRLTKFPDSSPVSLFPQRPRVNFYPAQFLSGAISPDGRCFARVYLHTQLNTKYLVISKKDGNKGLFIGFHDNVEEFHWLPDSKHVVFTASGSKRYHDGLFIWDLTKDRAYNLMTEEVEEPTRAQDMAKRFWLSIAGVSSNTKQPTVLAFISKKTAGSPLNPEKFYAPENAQAFTVTNKTVTRTGGTALFSQQEKLINQLHLLASTERTPEKQISPQKAKKWQDLQLAGPAEAVIHQWQVFSNKLVGKALFPYSLFYLTVLYGDAYTQLALQGAEHAEVMRTFGAEIARTLAEDKNAPTYLQALSAYHYQAFTEGRPLPYKISKLSLAPGD